MTCSLRRRLISLPPCDVFPSSLAEYLRLPSMPCSRLPFLTCPLRLVTRGLLPCAWFSVYRALVCSVYLSVRSQSALESMQRYDPHRMEGLDLLSTTLWHLKRDVRHAAWKLPSSASFIGDFTRKKKKKISSAPCFSFVTQKKSSVCEGIRKVFLLCDTFFQVCSL